jgi:hypothetical protein
MVIYSFYTGSDDSAQHFSSLHKAEVAAREELANFVDLDSVEVERNEVVPLNRANIIEILNSAGGHWARSSKVVSVVRRKGVKNERKN